MRPLDLATAGDPIFGVAITLQFLLRKQEGQTEEVFLSIEDARSLAAKLVDRAERSELLRSGRAKH